MKIDERFITPEVIATARKVAEKKVRKGWMVNPDNKMFAVAVKGIVNNGGNCPSKENEVFKVTQCPCHSYTSQGECYCGMYVKCNI